ncbi:MAG: hypothetical protein R3E60_06290 [Alphaproteobacteria bacterium]
MTEITQITSLRAYAEPRRVTGGNVVAERNYDADAAEIIAQAKALRAAYTREFFSDAVKGIIAWFSFQRRRWALIHMLEAQNDRVLEDIGIMRVDIPKIAARMARIIPVKTVVSTAQVLTMPQRIELNPGATVSLWIWRNAA